MAQRIAYSMNVREALKVARQLGCTVERGKGSELKLYHRALTKPVTVAGRPQEGVPRTFVKALRAIERSST